MRTSTLLSALALLPLAANAQDVFHYKFDSGCSTDALNYAEGTAAVGNGMLLTSSAAGPAASWTTGPWGQAMQGADKSGAATGDQWVDTGWVPGGYSGSFSYSFWLRNRPGNPTSISFGYLFGTDGGNFRAFTGSSGLMFTSGLGGGVTDLRSTTNFTQLWNAGWMHLALVVDVATMQATYYVNGAPETPLTLTGVPSLTGNAFALGRRTVASTGSAIGFDIDEAIFTLRALSAADVLTLSLGPWAGDATFGSGNGATLDSMGSPAFASTNYSMTVADPLGTSFVLMSGLGRCTIGGLPLPLDLGSVFSPLAGTPLLVSLDFIVTPPVPMAAGAGTLPLTIPNVTPVIGFQSFWQAFTITAGGALRSSNGLGLGIGI